MNARRRRLLAAAALAAPLAAWALPFASTERVLEGTDITWFFRGQFLLARESLARSAEPPRWNPTQYAGIPLLGNLQSHLYYPPNWIFLAVHPDNGYEIAVLLHMILGLAGCYRLARGFRIGRPGAVISSLAFVMSMCVTARVWAGHYPVLASMCATPLLLHLLRRLLEQPTPARTACLGAWTGWMILGGMVQWLYHAAIMSAGLIAWQVVPRIRRKEPWKKALLSAAGAAALGAALGAAAWLPSIQVTAESTRGESRYYMLDGERESTFHEDHLTHFVTPPFPWEAEADGRLLIHWHEQAMYIGILPLILAAAALIPPRRPIVWFLLAVAAFALLDASAGRIRFEPARWLIPGYATQRIPARSVWMAVFSFSLLAGFGWESLRTTGAATAKRLAWAAAAAIAATAWVTAACAGVPIRAGIATGLAVMSASALTTIQSSRTASACAVLLAAADLLFFGVHVQKVFDRSAYSAPPWYDAYIGPERRQYRLLDTTGANAFPTCHGFRLLNGYGHPTPRRLAALYEKAWEDYTGPRTESLGAGTRLKDPGILDLLNVRWIVSDNLRPHPRLREIARLDGKILYENEGAKPQAFLLDAGGSCSVIRPSPNRIEVLCRSDRPASLVVSETWMPGWRAASGGAPVAVGRAFDALLKIEVPAGESRVSLAYEPAAGRAGLWVTIAAAAAAAGLALVGRR